MRQRPAHLSLPFGCTAKPNHRPCLLRPGKQKSCARGTSPHGAAESAEPKARQGSEERRQVKLTDPSPSSTPTTTLRLPSIHSSCPGTNLSIPPIRVLPRRLTLPSRRTASRHTVRIARAFLPGSHSSRPFARGRAPETHINPATRREPHDDLAPPLSLPPLPPPLSSFQASLRRTASRPRLPCPRMVRTRRISSRRPSSLLLLSTAPIRRLPLSHTVPPGRPTTPTLLRPMPRLRRR